MWCVLGVCVSHSWIGRWRVSSVWRRSLTSPRTHTHSRYTSVSERALRSPHTPPSSSWSMWTICGWGLKVTCVSCLRLRTRSRPRTDTHTTSANKHPSPGLTVFRWTGLGWQQVTSGNPYTPSYTIVPYHVAIETLLSIILQADTPACLWSGGNFTWVQKFVSLCFLYDVPQFYIL